VPSRANIQLVEAATVCLINRERALRGVAPLHLSSAQSAAAEHHSRDMVARSYFDHDSPVGETPAERIEATGVLRNAVSFLVGENIAWATQGTDTPAATVAAWMRSPGHRANILERRYRDTGVGVVASLPRSLAAGARGAMYTQEFALIAQTIDPATRAVARRRSRAGGG
jgi:uncharacterized protein YkwD